MILILFQNGVKKSQGNSGTTEHVIYADHGGHSGGGHGGGGGSYSNYNGGWQRSHGDDLAYKAYTPPTADGP